jgi:hypothetical protein
MVFTVPINPGCDFAEIRVVPAQSFDNKNITVSLRDRIISVYTDTQRPLRGNLHDRRHSGGTSLSFAAMFKFAPVEFVEPTTIGLKAQSGNFRL